MKLGDITSGLQNNHILKLSICQVWSPFLHVWSPFLHVWSPFLHVWSPFLQHNPNASFNELPHLLLHVSSSDGGPLTFVCFVRQLWHNCVLKTLLMLIFNSLGQLNEWEFGCVVHISCALKDVRVLK